MHEHLKRKHVGQLNETESESDLPRQQMSKANFDSPPISPKTPASAVKCRTPRDRGQKCNSSVMSTFFQKRPITSPAHETQREGPVAQCVQRKKIKTECTQDANETDLHSVTAQLAVQEQMDVEETSVQRLVSVKQEDMAWNSSSTRDERAHSSSPSTEPKPVIKVECPVCSLSVSQQFINNHLDLCLTRGDKKESLRSSLGKTRRPMGKLVYNLLSQQELKRKLKECHLSVHGTREEMIKRHKEFVHIYNAQSDSLNPKSVEDIAKEIEANEKITKQLKGKAKPVAVFSKKQSEKEIDEWHANYRKQHSSDFSRLIAQVQGRLDKNRQTRIKQEVIVSKEEVQKTQPTDQVAEIKSCSEIKTEDREVDKELFARRAELSLSPACSDVSISSSVSDVFGPEPARIHEVTRTSVQKRESNSRETISSSPSFNLRKRRRKT